jgi:hypothetical protein
MVRTAFSFRITATIPVFLLYTFLCIKLVLIATIVAVIRKEKAVLTIRNANLIPVQLSKNSQNGRIYLLLVLFIRGMNRGFILQTCSGKSVGAGQTRMIKMPKLIKIQN